MRLFRRLEARLSLFAEKTGFKVSHHILEFRGICADSQYQNALDNEKKKE